MVQKRCAGTHRGSMPTSSMISQKSGCRRRIMAESALASCARSDRTTFERLLRSGTVNFIVLPTKILGPRFFAVIPWRYWVWQAP